VSAFTVKHALLVVLLAGSLALPASASATTVSGVEHALDGLPPLGTPGVAARSVSSVSSSFDDAAGTWTATVTFYAPQSASTEAAFELTLESTSKSSTASAGLKTWTNPASPRPRYFFDAGTAGSSTPSSPRTTATFADGDRSLTIHVQDPALVGEPFNELGLIRLSRGRARFDLLPAMVLYAPGAQGPAPSLVLPSSDRHLHVHGQQVPLTLGRLTLPVTVAAYIEVGGRPIATYEQSLAAKPPTFALSLLPEASSLLPRGKTRRGRLIVELYSKTGRLTVLRRQTAISR